LEECDWDAIVYGDDSLIGLKNRSKEFPSHFALRKNLIKTMTKVFGVTLDPVETKLSTQRFVNIKVPIYVGDTSKGTSSMPVHHYEYHEDEPSTGVYALTSSHRWQYNFANTWSFLGYSMLKDGRMIRPTFDVLTRIYNPEKPVESWDDHITALKMALLENYENAHTRNRIYHYLLDAWWCLRTYGHQRVLDWDDLGIGKGRAWYRYVDEWVDLRTHPSTRIFNRYWDNLTTNLIMTRTRLPFNDEYYRFVRRSRVATSFIDPKMKARRGISMFDALKTMGIAEPNKQNYRIFARGVLSKFDDTEMLVKYTTQRFKYYDYLRGWSTQKKLEKFKNILTSERLTTFRSEVKKIMNVDMLQFIGIEYYEIRK